MSEETRYLLSVDFEDEEDIDAFLDFIKYHSRRLRCPVKDVFLRLAKEWQNELRVEENERARSVRDTTSKT